MRKKFQAARAFTLIELLVVVAIIALLISILIPALSKARETARATHCASGLRQWGFAVYYYLNDWQQALPEEGIPGNATSTYAWYNTLPPYVNAPTYGSIYAGQTARVGANGITAYSDTGYKNNWIWYCQTELLKSKNSGPNLNSFHYEFNAVLDGSGSYGPDEGVTFTKLTAIPDPANTPLLFESKNNSPNDDPTLIDPRHGSGFSNILLTDQHVDRTVYKGALPTLIGGYWTTAGNPRLVWGRF